MAAAVLALLGLSGATGAAAAAERLEGPIVAEVVSVLDGDTIEVRARVWLGQVIGTRVRLAGIDAPDLTGPCARERDLAARARDLLRARLPAPADGLALVRLHDVRYGKYAGRVLARVLTEAGEDLGGSLLAAGLARRYAGGARTSWCAEAAQDQHPS